MSECIISPSGTRLKHGYAMVWDKALKRQVLHHRQVWAEVNGPIPAGMMVRHTCDNPPCININHLLIGTQTDNMRDMMERGRHGRYNAAKTHCIHGHAFTPENTYTKPDGKRQCRACGRRISEAYRQRNLP